MKNSVKLAAMVLVVAAIILIVNNADIIKIVSDPYSLVYEGETRHFRSNLIEANKTAVYPDELSVMNVLLGTDVYKIQIAFVPNATENAYYFADTFEITSKMGLVYRNYFEGNVTTFKDADNSTCLLWYEQRQTRCFKSVPVNSTSELVPTSVEPVIFLAGPSQANETGVSVNNSLITLSGASFNESYRNYNDLDLATDKMLLILMASDNQ
jgi:hypothetical protein